MAYEQKDNTGSLFKNERREKDTHAHARDCVLLAEEYLEFAATHLPNREQKDAA